MRLPSSQQRVLINGRTGSGKTTAAVWLLAMSNWTTSPWIVLNHKNTAAIDAIPGAKHVDMNFRPDTKKGGIFIYHPIPGKDDEAVDQLLWWIWAHGHVGVFIDEGYMISPRSDALNALYTQGREKHIPMLTLSQRPSGISRFAISESDFYMLYHIVDRDDRKRLQGYIPVALDPLMGVDWSEERLLPEFHSLYYDVGKNALEIITPVPLEQAVMQIFIDRGGLSKPKNRLI